jgi:hypothetical protein
MHCFRGLKVRPLSLLVAAPALVLAACGAEAPNNDSLVPFTSNPDQPGADDGNGDGPAASDGDNPSTDGNPGATGGGDTEQAPGIDTSGLGAGDPHRSCQRISIFPASSAV